MTAADAMPAAGRPKDPPRETPPRCRSPASPSLAACRSAATIADGGVYITRRACPQLGIPAGTGDITLFDPAGQHRCRARSTSSRRSPICAPPATRPAPRSVSIASFDVVATRRDAGPARQVVLPFFDVVMQGGNGSSPSRSAGSALNFAAGSHPRPDPVQARCGSIARSTRPARGRPRELTRRRKTGDADAAVDPLSDPEDPRRGRPRHLRASGRLPADPGATALQRHALAGSSPRPR